MLSIGSVMLQVKTGSVPDPIDSIPDPLAAFRTLFAAFQTLTGSVPDPFGSIPKLRGSGTLLVKTVSFLDPFSRVGYNIHDFENVLKTVHYYTSRLIGLLASSPVMIKSSEEIVIFHHVTVFLFCYWV